MTPHWWHWLGLVLMLVGIGGYYLEQVSSLDEALPGFSDSVRERGQLFLALGALVFFTTPLMAVVVGGSVAYLARGRRCLLTSPQWRELNWLDRLSVILAWPLIGGAVMWD